MTKYPKIQIQLHWLMFLLIALAAVSVEVSEIFPKGSYMRAELKNIHIWLGESVFVFLILRILTRLSFKQPQIFSDISWQVTLVKLVYASFYLLMLIIPITGLFLLQAGGKEALFFGYALPEVIAPDRELKKIIKEIHEFLSNGFYLLIIFHVAAAFWHHYILKDDSFKRMRL